uniref:Autophagy-related protein 2 n=1 Tax=Macrostomum lignano TaxID=282301 RepID=A0A1I8FVL3_9PLAT
SLNEVFRNQNIPLEMAEGIVEEISVSIPWSALVSEPSVVEVRGLRVTLSPSNRVDAMVSSQLLDSMLGSMVTSMQVAETCVRETPEEKQSGTEGVQRIANTIDTVLSKIRVTLIDSRITLVCRRLDKSVSLQVRIGQAEYFDTAEAPSNVPTPSDQPSSFSNLLLYKSLRLSGLALYLDDAPIVEAFAGRTKGTGQLQRRRRHIGDVAGGPSSRPMSLDDRQRIEEQLLSTSLGQPGELDDDDVGGFRSDSETDEDEQFYSMGPMEDAAGQPDMAESCHSDSTWQPGKNWATAASGTGARLGLPKQCKRPFAFDGSEDITPSRVMGLTGELALLTFTVLHSDPETTHDGIDQPVSGRDKLAALSESFFSLIRGLDVNEQPQNLRALRLAMVDLCPHDHLGPLKLTYTLEESRQLGKSSLSVSMGLADFTETLFERKAEPTLALPKPSDLVPRVCDVVAFPEQSLHSSQPSIRIDFVQTERH